MVLRTGLLFSRGVGSFYQQPTTQPGRQLAGIPLPLFEVLPTSAGSLNTPSS